MTQYKLSGLSRQVGMSGTLAIEARFQELKAQGKDVISLGAGQPDFDSPPAARAGGIQAIEQNFTRYTEVAGIPSLRALIARKLKEENGLEYAPGEIVVAAGAKPAIYHALLAFADPGDEVLLPTPAWPSYMDMARLVGAKPVEIPIAAASGYKLTAEALVRALRGGSGGARLLLFSNPCNPTGAVYSPDELRRLAEVVRGEDLSVIVDEIYERLVFDVPFLSMATLPGMRERAVTVNGVSKSFAMTGWRIGYAAGPAAVMKAMRSMQSHTSGNPCSISQKAAEAALAAELDGGEGREILLRMKQAFALRRDLVARLLDDIPGLTYVRPDGAFYFFVDVSAHYDRMFSGQDPRFAGAAQEAGAPRSKLLAQYLLEQGGVAVVPGADFGDDRCIRISFASSAEDLSVALKRIGKALAA
jgi:aspartate/methionine/tyrosine aminotransferase